MMCSNNSSFSLEQMVEREETYLASVVLDQLKGFTDEAKQAMMYDARLVALSLCSYVICPSQW